MQARPGKPSSGSAKTFSTQNADDDPDYARMSLAIRYLVEHVIEQPRLETVAAQVGLSPHHFQRMFTRWAGVSPKRFLQILTVDRGKALLAQGSPLLSVSDELGLSSASRLYDHFVNLEAMTPGMYKNGGALLEIHYGIHETPFGKAIMAATARGICKLGFLDSSADAAIEELRHEWPAAQISCNPLATQPLIEALFAPARLIDRPLSLLVKGTNFQVSVWRALLQVPFASVTSYADIAKAIGRPSAARAVGRAVGKNPVAYLIPCHRVIQQSGQLGGYRWGVLRKQSMHVWESARAEFSEGK